MLLYSKITVMFCLVFLIFEEVGFAGNVVIIVMQRSSVTAYCCWFLMASASLTSLCLVVIWSHSLDVLLMNLKSMVYFIMLH